MRNSWGFELGTSDIRLMYRDDLAWAEVARARIEGPDFEERMKAMVALIEDDAAADLLFPRSQILYADVRIDPDSTTRQELERVLCEHMPHGTGELDLDWEVTVHGAVRVAAISVETLKEALDFASAQGIRVGELSSLADPVDFPRTPRFCGRDAEVPLASMIEDASISKARKIPIPGLIPAARMGGRLMHLLGTAGHRFPQRQRTGAMFAAALAAALGVAALLWTALPPESTTFEQALGKGPESGLATGAPVTGPELAAQAPESVDTESGLLLHQPPVAHTDARQLSDLWRRSELQAPAEGAGIAPAPLTKALASTQPRFPPLPTAGREAPQRADTASGLLLQQPPVVQADAGRLADLWRRSELQVPANGAGIFAEPLPTAQTLALPHVPPSPQAGHEAPQRVDIANGLLLQQPPDVHADAHQVADQWRQGQIRVPAGEVGMTAAPLPSSLALTQPHLPPSPQAGHEAPQRADTANGLLLQQPPDVRADAHLVADQWRQGELQAPAGEVGITAAPLPTALALAQPHLPPSPRTGHKAPQRVDTASGLLLQQPPVVQADAHLVANQWRRGELQAPAGEVGITAAPLANALALAQPRVAPWPHAGPSAPPVLDVPLPAGRDSLAPAAADRLMPHDGSPPGTKPAIDLPAYALRETGDVPERPVDGGPAPALAAGNPPVPPELQPRMRPDGFAEHVERLKFGGRTLAELATLRAQPRPESAQQLAASSAEPTAATIGSGSSAPGMRPENFDAVVAAVDTQRRLAAAARVRRALDAARNAESALVADAEPELTQADRAASGTPSRSTVATRATIPNAIRLNEVNLVGVYGTTGDRRALVRLPSGRFVRVRVGDRVDGGRVARITESELFYQKGNRTVSLSVPRG